MHKAFKSGGRLKQSATTLFPPEMYLTMVVSCATYESWLSCRAVACFMGDVTALTNGL